MKDEGYMAVICAVLYDDDGNGKDEDRGNRAQLLEHIQEVSIILALQSLFDYYSDYCNILLMSLPSLVIIIIILLLLLFILRLEVE